MMSPIHVETADIPSYVVNKVMIATTITGEVAEAVHLSAALAEEWEAVAVPAHVSKKNVVQCPSFEIN